MGFGVKGLGYRVWGLGLGLVERGGSGTHAVLEAAKNSSSRRGTPETLEA